MRQQCNLELDTNDSLSVLTGGSSPCAGGGGGNVADSCTQTMSAVHSEGVREGVAQTELQLSSGSNGIHRRSCDADTDLEQVKS